MIGGFHHRTALLPTVTDPRAACLEVDPEVFWPPPQGRGTNATEALAVCGRCPVRAACLKAVLSWRPMHRNVGMVMGGRYWPSKPRGA